MNLTTTLLFYLLIGCCVAVSVYLAIDGGTSRGRWFPAITAVLFWPLYLPVLLQRPAGVARRVGADFSWDAGSVVPAHQNPPDTPPDEIAQAVQHVEAELDLALRSLDGWSDAVLAREQHRFEELRAAWHAQAQKIHELDRLLDQPAFKDSSQPHRAAFARSDGDTRIATSERSRQANIARLRAVRQRMHDDLVNTLAWVRELVTMIHLAKYTGAPASRAEELVMQIATSIEGLSEVAAWREEDQAAFAPHVPSRCLPRAASPFPSGAGNGFLRGGLTPQQ